MKLKWERNSRVSSLAAQGKIHPDDIIHRTTTDKFPAGAATVRMPRVREKVPYITLHIRGASNLRKYKWNNEQIECAETCRVNLGGHWATSMCSNGLLDESLTWLDVHNVVTRVKEAMDIN